MSQGGDPPPPYEKGSTERHQPITTLSCYRQKRVVIERCTRSQWRHRQHRGGGGAAGCSLAAAPPSCWRRKNSSEPLEQLKLHCSGPNHAEKALKGHPSPRGDLAASCCHSSGPGGPGRAEQPPSNPPLGPGGGPSGPGSGLRCSR